MDDFLEKSLVQAVTGVYTELHSGLYLPSGQQLRSLWVDVREGDKIKSLGLCDYAVVEYRDGSWNTANRLLERR